MTNVLIYKRLHSSADFGLYPTIIRFEVKHGQQPGVEVNLDGRIIQVFHESQPHEATIRDIQTHREQGGNSGDHILPADGRTTFNFKTTEAWYCFSHAAKER